MLSLSVVTDTDCTWATTITITAAGITDTITAIMAGITTPVTVDGIMAVVTIVATVTLASGIAGIGILAVGGGIEQRVL